MENLDWRCLCPCSVSVSSVALLAAFMLCSTNNRLFVECLHALTRTTTPAIDACFFARILLVGAISYTFCSPIASLLAMTAVCQLWVLCPVMSIAAKMRQARQPNIGCHSAKLIKFTLVLMLLTHSHYHVIKCSPCAPLLDSNY